jgi:hypothetical protein
MRHSVLYVEDNYNINKLSSLTKDKYFSFYLRNSFERDMFTYSIFKRNSFYYVSSRLEYCGSSCLQEEE